LERFRHVNTVLIGDDNERIGVFEKIAQADLVFLVGGIAVIIL